MSPGLIRARKGFLIPNVLTGLGLGVFIVGVWAYSINAVKQENFDDIDDEVRQLNAKNALSKSRPPVVLTEVDRELHATSTPSGPSIASSTQHHTIEENKKRFGLLPSLIDPKFLDPETHTLVWGAPPVGSPGRLWERK